MAADRDRLQQQLEEAKRQHQAALAHHHANHHHHVPAAPVLQTRSSLHSQVRSCVPGAHGRKPSAWLSPPAPCHVRPNSLLAHPALPPQAQGSLNSGSGGGSRPASLSGQHSNHMLPASAGSSGAAAAAAAAAAAEVESLHQRLRLAQQRAEAAEAAAAAAAAWAAQLLALVQRSREALELLQASDQSSSKVRSQPHLSSFHVCVSPCVLASTWTPRQSRNPATRHLRCLAAPFRHASAKKHTCARAPRCVVPARPPCPCFARRRCGSSRRRSSRR